MAFQKKQWQFNDIITEGELNRMEDGIEEGIAKAEQAEQIAQQSEQTANQTASDLASHLADNMPHSEYVAQLGNTDQTVNLSRALNQRIDSRSVTLTYDANGRLTTVTEKDGATTVKTTSLNYDTNGNLTTVTEQVVGKTITTTLTYTDGRLTSIARSVA